MDDGYNIYTDFSKKIILHNKNVINFLNSFKKLNYKKETDLYIGFFGYEILNNLLGLKIKNQKKINFYKGVFYELYGSFDFAWYISIALSIFAGLIHLPIKEKAIERVQTA